MQVGTQYSELSRQSARCEAGAKDACYSLGFAHEHGEAPYGFGTEIVIRDMRQAAYYFSKGCTLGDMFSCSLLADHYLNGTGIPRDEAKAVRLHSEVCNGPLVEMTKFSCRTAGDLLVKGIGGRLDFQLGIAYLDKACMLGSSFGCQIHEQYAGTGRVLDVEPPKGAIGFTFGWSVDQARTTCVELHGKWSSGEKKGEGKFARCSLHVSALDHDVSATLGFVDDQLAWVSANYDPDQANALREYNRVGELLVKSYGIPSRRRSIVPDSCGNQAFALCLASNKASFDMLWEFKNRQYSINLYLLGTSNGKVFIFLLYTAPKSDRLVGNPGL